MGWFDDSDDEDTHAKKKAKINDDGIDQIESYMAGIKREVKEQEKKGEEEEEVDPLDAFMATLSSSSSTKEKNTQSHNKFSEERLDYDNEDEATSHWVSSNLSVKNSKKEKSQTALSSSLAKNNKRAATNLELTFHKEGAKPSFSCSQSSKSYNDSESDDEFKGLKGSNRTIVSKNNDVEPLSLINHENMDYAPFCRCFHSSNPSNILVGEKEKVNNGNSWRKEHNITISPASFAAKIELQPLLTPFSSPPFSDLFPKPIIKSLSNSNLQKPTVVQAQAIPVALAGKDVIVTATTGSGKTLSYILPMILHCLDQPQIIPNKDGPIGLVLAPTRELALQIHSIAKKLMKQCGGIVICATGGNKGSYELKKELKRGCEMIVSTPGRLIEMIKSKATNLGRVTIVTLDEADRMLEMGFQDQVSCIMKNIRPDRHTMMFSATFGKRVEKIAEGWLKKPIRIAVGQTGASSKHVAQHIISLPNQSSKLVWLTSMLPTLVSIGKVIVFVSSRLECENVISSLRADTTCSSLRMESIHGDRHQSDRNAALKMFKGSGQVLVCTDVAARGLDFNVATVINFDCAKNIDIHVHRIGRAGRLMKSAEKTKGDMTGVVSQEVCYQKGDAYTLMISNTDNNKNNKGYGSRDVDFANLLLENFVKEGKEVSPELSRLSQQSKYYGRGSDRGQKRNFHGIGFGSNAMASSNCGAHKK